MAYLATKLATSETRKNQVFIDPLINTNEV